MGDRFRVAMVIGEESGDQLGAALIDAIRRIRPGADFFGLAGRRMQVRGVQSLFPTEDVAVMGFGAIIRHLPRIVIRGYQTVAAIVDYRPDVLVIIDSPGFTHAIAKRVARMMPGLPIVDYVSPSVWAWRSGRASKMARYVDHVLALLPFEPAVHARLGGPPCTYVGHPLIERLDELRPAAGERGPISSNPVLLILPGSRRTEITRLMAPFGEAAAQIAKVRPGLEILLPAVTHLREEIGARAALWPVRPKVVLGEAEKLAAFRRAHAALAASGTVTLELGLAGVPMVVAYRVDPIARGLKRFLKVPSIVLTNLVLGENAVPEFLDEEGSPEILARETAALLAETPARAAQLAAVRRLDQLMAPPGGMRPSDRAAQIVVGFAQSEARRRRDQRRAEIGT